MNRFSFFSILCLLFLPSVVLADITLWTGISQSHRSLEVESEKAGFIFQVDSTKLKQQLSRATHEGRSTAHIQIKLPFKNGGIESFTVEESPVMSAGLSAKYPQIKSYRIRGIDHLDATGRISLSPKGFHGMITDATGTYYIDPDKNDVYRSYRKKSQKISQSFNCGVEGHSHDSPVSHVARRAANRTAGTVRVYRLAVAATTEYVTKVGGTKIAAMSEIHNAINRVNQIYERDLSIRLELIDNNDELIYTSSDPYSNNDGYTMLNENQLNIDSVIGSSNYDIGHVFSTGGGGVATVGSVCGVDKAEGVTGSSNPTGESFYVDFVAHEIGHQFNAEHTFNGTESGCGGTNRWQPTAFEPGSGSTIMSYAGICGSENITANADAIFHAGSIDLIDTFIASPSDCGVLTSINNPALPQVDAGSGYNIPRSTPFILTASASDTDGDSITYTWDQMDAGLATDSTSLGKDLGTNSLFRSYLPRSENERHFPALGTTVQNKYDDSETLPCKTRSLNFDVTVRDGQGGIAKDDLLLSVDNGSGPFQITSFNQSETLSPGEHFIRWEVAATNLVPVSCQQVDISLLTFNADKTSYAENVLLSDQPNIGFAEITLADKSNSASRFKIQCSDNVFYDISDADLIIDGASPFSTDDQTVFYNIDGPSYSYINTPAESCVGLDNNSPVVVDDSIVLEQGASIDASVLTNDSDPDGDTLVIVHVTQGKHGSVVLNPDKTVTYTADLAFNGQDSFYYSVTDDKGSFSTALVDVIVRQADSTLLILDDSASLNEDSSVNIDVLDNDIDSDGDTLVVFNTTHGSNGEVSINLDGSLDYQPNLNYFGSDSFTYTVSDGGSSFDTATVTINVLPVNDAPVAFSDEATMVEGYNLTIDVLANDSDVESDTLSINSVTQGQNGIVIFNSAGVISYTPDLAFNGTDSFTYTVSDGELISNNATVNVSVIPLARESSSGGGGAFSLLSIFALLSIGLLRRKIRH